MEKGESQKDESELEEEIEDEESKNEKLDPEKLQKFIQQRDFFPNQEIEVEDNSPSLERRDISQNIPVRLEQGIADSTTVKTNEENDPFNYSAKASQKDEPKYQNNMDETFAPKRTEIENLGRDDFQQQVGFVSSRENINSINQEKYEVAKTQDISSLGKNENPFERKEIKYEPSEKPLS